MVGGILISMSFVYKVFRTALEWVETCPCHGHLDWGAVDTETRHRWAHCHCRAHRLPEIAAGDLMRNLRSWLGATAGELYMALPGDLSDADRGQCLRACASGRAHVLFVFTVKLHAFETHLCSSSPALATIDKPVCVRCRAAWNLVTGTPGAAAAGATTVW